MAQDKFRITCFLAFSISAITCPAVAGEAHVHGRAGLQVAIEGSSVTVMLESPVESLLGFEHRPANAQEKTAFDNITALLRQPEKWLVFPGEANCHAVSATLQSPLLAESPGAATSTHADLDGEFGFRCEHPEKLLGFTVKLFDAASSLHELDIQVVHDHGQTAGKLDTHRRTLTWQAGQP